jgi:hypothetical protein
MATSRGQAGAEASIVFLLYADGADYLFLLHTLQPQTQQGLPVFAPFTVVNRESKTVQVDVLYP